MTAFQQMSQNAMFTYKRKKGNCELSSVSQFHLAAPTTSLLFTMFTADERRVLLLVDVTDMSWNLSVREGQKNLIKPSVVVPNTHFYT